MTKRTWVRAGIVATVVIAVVVAMLYVELWVPNMKLLDLEWYKLTSPAEQVRVAHKVLRWPWGNHHDAFIILLEKGGPESVPVLIRALQWQKDTGPGGSMVCTKLHCLMALRRITGEDAGLNYADWARWWKIKGGKWQQMNTTHGEGER